MSENESSAHVVETVLEEIKHDVSEELSWNRWIALSSVIFAVISAFCGLGANLSSHEGSRYRDERTLAVAALSGKQAVIHVLQSQKSLLKALDLPADPNISSVIADIEKESAEYHTLAKVSDETSEIELNTNHMFEYASAFLGVSIGLCGLAILLRRKWVWGFGMVLGSVGSIFTGAAFLYRFSYF